MISLHLSAQITKRAELGEINKRRGYLSANQHNLIKPGISEEVIAAPGSPSQLILSVQRHVLLL